MNEDVLLIKTRKLLDLTQENVANRAKMSRYTYATFENGYYTYKSEGKRLAVCLKIKVALEELIAEEKNPTWQKYATKYFKEWCESKGI